ncbi:MAG: hypothetical protein JWM04_1462 [Verrucomicrobiales bacterium]|nr:hypothetical protein [Verrucomicrobiales bacterium]
MPVQFESIQVGSEYDRNELASLWGYKSFHALARGVFTPRNQNIIVLFVTEEKQENFTQYADRLVGNTLTWEGEDGHGSDTRMSEASRRGDEIYLFYRKRHHAAFIFMGQVRLTKAKVFSNKPSEFEFDLLK